ncbi:DUF4339 domain-containing protein [Prevotella sp. A2931]|uniref:DUF4339 domain-containing protein n=1 Tax=Prevotella illustrans TaxID=2800387 RepID=A0ABS3M4W6_9BACT|nr:MULTISPECIES: GYF domain-containing protein [Prevotella]MBO1363214.1 DUF4339 domain-containing protein [Prevotella illustrans]
MRYFIIENNQQAGPFSIYELKDKGITSETLVWSEGMANWTPAWQVEELKNFLFNTQATSTPPPFNPQEHPKTADNDRQAGTNQAYREPLQPQKPKKKRPFGKIIVGLVVVIALLFAFTNPGKRDHQDAIRDSLTSFLNKKAADTEDNIFAAGMRMISRMMTGSIVDALSETLEYHNYILFSKTTVNWNGKEHTVSFGILGKVITLNDDDIAKALEKKKLRMPSQQDESGTIDSQNTDDENETGVSKDDDSDGPTDEITKQAKDKIVNSIGKMVKKKVAEETDSATESGISKIIDDILNLFK